MRLVDLCPVEIPADPRLPAEVFIGPDALEALPDLVQRYLGEAPFWLADPETWAAAGLAGDPWLLESHPHADDATAARVTAASLGCTGIVAIGSGTINDLAKKAAAAHGVGFVIVGTASSMNGYASAIAAILSNGLKTTQPAAPARAIVLDTGILGAAPPALTRAGLGDLLSKPVSDTDWWLADQLEGSGYSALPGAIVDHAVQAASDAAGGLMSGDAKAHTALGTALTLSGVAMVVAGSSSPASGGEHLLSHLWDMEALVKGDETRLHGAQVGVTSCITAAIYQRLLALESPDFAEPRPWAEEEARIRAAHGALADVVVPQAKAKHARAGDRLTTLRERWPAIREGLKARALPTSADLRAILSACAAPSTLAALGADRDDTARILNIARDIRDRVTVLDVAYAVGILPGSAAAVLDEAGV